MNVPLLREIQQRILAEPDAFRMDKWTCGSAHCIAGWACALRGYKLHREHDYTRRKWHVFERHVPIAIAARALLGITSDKAGNLFHVATWPEQFLSAYDRTTNRTARAAIATERIEHFIATDGAE